MLILTRLPGEAVDIRAPGGLPVMVKVLEIDRGKVRLGFDADRSVEINRREVTIRIEGAQMEKMHRPEPHATIEIPDCLSIVAHEFGQRWPVVGATQKIARARLAYADVKTPVPCDADLIVEFEAGNQSAAEALAIRLRAGGYAHVETELVAQRHEIGGEGEAA